MYNLPAITNAENVIDAYLVNDATKVGALLDNMTMCEKATFIDYVTTELGHGELCLDILKSYYKGTCV